MAKKKAKAKDSEDSGEDRKSFRDVLDMNSDDAKKPEPLPIGHWLLMIGEQSFTKAQNEEQTDICRYIARPVEFHEDVDEEDLKDGWERRTLRLDFFLQEDSVWRLKEFMEKCGLDVEGRSFGELIPEASECQVWAYIDQEPSKKPGSEEIYNRVTRYMAEPD